MTEHLTSANIEQYRRRELSPAELLRVDDHLVECDECRSRLIESGQAMQILRSLDENLQTEAAMAGSDHLTFEHLTALVDETADTTDRQIAESHLESCGMCTGELQDLRAFRASLDEATPETKVAIQDAPAFAERFSAFRRWFQIPSPLKFAGATLAILLVSLTALFLWRQSRLTTQVATSGPTPTETASPDSRSIVSATPPAIESASPQITVVLNDGDGSVTLDGAGVVKGLEALSPEAQQAVRNALTSGRVDSGSLAGLKGKPGTLMGPAPDASMRFSLVGPVGKVVRSSRPRLSWRPLQDATSYTVTVVDADNQVVVTSPPLTNTSWTPPTSLHRGRIYKWQVAAVKDGQQVISPAPPASDALFKILEKQKEDELRAVEQNAARSHLGRGVMYTRVGLLDEAEAEFRALVAANPQSEVARNLLRSVREAKNRQR